MPLFVILREGVSLTDDLRRRIKQKIREDISPRHVPSQIFAIDQIPYTLSGKKMEVPIKKLLLGAPPERIANPDAMANPEVLVWYADYARSLQAGRQSALAPALETWRT